MGPWQVGVATDPQNDDKTYATVEEAYIAAYDLSSKKGNRNTVYAIWDHDDCPVSLYFDGLEFKG